jgi:hypothetical protein
VHDTTSIVSRSGAERKMLLASTQMRVDVRTHVVGSDSFDRMLQVTGSC